MSFIRGIPNPPGSPHEKFLYPPKAVPTFDALEREFQFTGMDPELVGKLSRAFSRYSEKHLIRDEDVRKVFEYWANRHTHEFIEVEEPPSGIPYDPEKFVLLAHRSGTSGPLFRHSLVDGTVIDNVSASPLDSNNGNRLMACQATKTFFGNSRVNNILSLVEVFNDISSELKDSVDLGGTNSLANFGTLVSEEAETVVIFHRGSGSSVYRAFGFSLTGDHLWTVTWGHSNLSQRMPFAFRLEGLDYIFNSSTAQTTNDIIQQNLWTIDYSSGEHTLVHSFMVNEFRTGLALAPNRENIYGLQRVTTTGPFKLHRINVSELQNSVVAELPFTPMGVFAAISPDNNLYVTPSEVRNVTAWNLSTGQVEWDTELPIGTATGSTYTGALNKFTTVSPDGSILYVGCGRWLAAVRMVDGEVLWVDNPGLVSNVADMATLWLGA